MLFQRDRLVDYFLLHSLIFLFLDLSREWKLRACYVNNVAFLRSSPNSLVCRIGPIFEILINGAILMQAQTLLQPVLGLWILLILGEVVSTGIRGY